MNPRHPSFSELNDPTPDGQKPRWISLRTGLPAETDNTTIPQGFNRWVRTKPATRAVVMMALCTIGQYRFKASMTFLARKCGMTDRNFRRCIADLESGGWITRKFTKRGGTLWGWNLFSLPHLAGGSPITRKQGDRKVRHG